MVCIGRVCIVVSIGVVCIGSVGIVVSIGVVCIARTLILKSSVVVCIGQFFYCVSSGVEVSALPQVPGMSTLHRHNTLSMYCARVCIVCAQIKLSPIETARICKS